MIVRLTDIDRRKCSCHRADFSDTLNRFCGKNPRMMSMSFFAVEDRKQYNLGAKTRSLPPCALLSTSPLVLKPELSYTTRGSTLFWQTPQPDNSILAARSQKPPIRRKSDTNHGCPCEMFIAQSSQQGDFLLICHIP